VELSKGTLITTFPMEVFGDGLLCRERPYFSWNWGRLIESLKVFVTTTWGRIDILFSS